MQELPIGTALAGCEIPGRLAALRSLPPCSTLLSYSIVKLWRLMHDNLHLWFLPLPGKQTFHQSNVESLKGKLPVHQYSSMGTTRSGPWKKPVVKERSVDVPLIVWQGLE